MDEFAFIRERLAPLAKDAPGARGLIDDAATLVPPQGAELVLTADALVAGVHFRADDPLDAVAAKCLRVNLSDLAAKGAEPLGYLLSVVWPRGFGDAEKGLFVDGLARDQERFGIPLLGGDTNAADVPLTVAVTAIGATPRGAFVPRSGARPGDAVYVTGAIGDAGLGLKALEGALSGLSKARRAALVERYRLPEPRLEAAEALRRVAHAAIDVSDGLLADAGHVADASGAAIRIEAGRIPLSSDAASWLAAQPSSAAAIAELAGAGDDYEVLFTGPAAAGEIMEEVAGLRVTRIGEVAAGAGVTLLDEQGRPIAVERSGFTHF